MYQNTDIFSVAQEYVSNGIAIFPCKRTKEPLTPHGCKDATTEQATINVWWSQKHSGANIGIATGKVSGVCVIDFDDIGLLPQLEAIVGTLPKTPTVQTREGRRHLYFRDDPRWRNVKNSTKLLGGIDIRADNGYVIAPPSVHETGVRYTWIVSPDECDYAIAPQSLIDWLPKRDDTPTKATTPTVNDTSARRCEVGTITIRATTLLERAKLYLDKAPPAVSGNGGHNATYTVVCRLVELFGLLSDDELLDALEAWNARCLPPWNEKELRHKLKEARKRVVTQTTDATLPVPTPVSADDWPVLDKAAYHGIVGEILNAIEPQTEADIAGVLVSLLAGIGNLLGKSSYVPVGADMHHANLFVALVGDTASGKGQAWNIVNRLLSRVDPLWADTCIGYGLASGEGLVDRLSDDVAEDGMIRIQETKRLLCLESEFARPITAMRREGNTLSPLIRAAWDCKPLEVMTRGKSKLRASDAYVSVVAHITQEELSKLLSGSVEIANGFSNRFLWTLVRSSKSLPHGGDVSVLDTFADRLKGLLAMPGRKTIRSPEADRLWESVYEELKESKAGAYGKATERGRAQVVRLSLLYAALDSSPIVTADHLRAALAVWRYCDDSARIVFGGVADEGNKLERRFRETVERQPGISKTDLRNTVSKSTPTERIDAAIQRLVDRGDIVHVPAYGDGERRVESYYPGIGKWGNGDSGSVTIPNPEVAPQIPISPTQTQPATSAATLAELFDWRNAHGVVFERRADIGIWVTPDYVPALTPAIEQAIRDNQTILESFVPEGQLILSESEFLRELDATIP